MKCISGIWVIVAYVKIKSRYNILLSSKCIWKYCPHDFLKSPSYMWLVHGTTEHSELLWCQLCCHLWHWRELHQELSWCQLWPHCWHLWPVPPVMTKLAWWQLLGYDNLQPCQWWQSWHHSRISMFGDFFLLTHWPLGDFNKFLEKKIQTNFSDWWLWYLKWNCRQINITGP